MNEQMTRAEAINHIIETEQAFEDTRVPPEDCEESMGYTLAALRALGVTDEEMSA